MKQQRYSKDTHEDDIDDFMLPESNPSFNLRPQESNNSNPHSFSNVPAMIGTRPHELESSETHSFSNIPPKNFTRPLPPSSYVQVPNHTTGTYFAKTNNIISGISNSANANDIYSHPSDTVNRYPTVASLEGSFSNQLVPKSLRLSDITAMSSQGKLLSSTTKADARVYSTSNQVASGSIDNNTKSSFSARRDLPNSTTKSDTNQFNTSNQLGPGVLRLTDIIAKRPQGKLPSTATKANTSISTPSQIASSFIDNNTKSSFSAQKNLPNSTTRTDTNLYNTSKQLVPGKLRLKDIATLTAQGKLPNSTTKANTDIYNIPNQIASSYLDNNKINSLSAQGNLSSSTTKAETNICDAPILITSLNDSDEIIFSDNEDDFKEMLELQLKLYPNHQNTQVASKAVSEDNKDSEKMVPKHDSDELVFSDNEEDWREFLELEARKRTKLDSQTASDKVPTQPLNFEPQLPPPISARPSFPQTIANARGGDIKESQLPKVVARDQQLEIKPNETFVSKAEDVLSEDIYAESDFEDLEIYHQSKQLPAPTINNLPATPRPLHESPVGLKSGPSISLIQEKNLKPTLDNFVDNLRKNAKMTEVSKVQKVPNARGDLIGMGFVTPKPYCPPKDYYELHFDHTPVAYDDEAVSTWIYPINYPLRDYQFNIVQRCLFENTLVVLPTGLGKTFIASVVMLNYYRWFPGHKVLFMAPTRPLVAQQIEACFNICGIQDAQELTGLTSSAKRQYIWSGNRVFYSTPQVVCNDLKTELLDPCDISCVVIDEAHKAQGSYAYVDVIKFIYAKNPLVRVVALSATPGTDLTKVQQVVANLNIARVEFRTESSLDVEPYSFEKQIDKYIVKLEGEHIKIASILKELVQPSLDFLVGCKLFFQRSPDSVSNYQLVLARDRFKSHINDFKQYQQGRIWADFGLATSLITFLDCFTRYGVTTLYSKLTEWVKASPPKYRLAFIQKPRFQELVSKLEDIMQQPNYSSHFLSHPKLGVLCSCLRHHFCDETNPPESQTKVIVFAQFRENVEEIYNALKQMMPVVRPTLFTGQGASKLGSKGMSQKDQLKTIVGFKEGNYNVLVATCIGEEGLDIGEVDLIICYDSNSSPIRLLQRMGRTGRRRKGKVYMFLSEGQEENNYSVSQKKYNTVLNQIKQGKLMMFPNNPRILPTSKNPICEKKNIMIPEKPSILASTRKRQKRPANISLDEATNEEVQMLFGRNSLSQPPNIRRLISNSYRHHHLLTTTNYHMISHSPRSKLLVDITRQCQPTDPVHDSYESLPGIEELFDICTDTRSRLDQFSNKTTKLPVCARNKPEPANTINPDNINHRPNNEKLQPDNQCHQVVLIDLISSSPPPPRATNQSGHCFSELPAKMNPDTIKPPSQTVILPCDVNQDTDTPQPLIGFRDIDKRVALFNHRVSILLNQSISSHSSDENEATVLAQVFASSNKEGEEPTSQASDKILPPAISQVELGNNNTVDDSDDDDGIVLKNRKRNRQPILATPTTTPKVNRHHSKDTKRKKLNCKDLLDIEARHSSTSNSGSDFDDGHGDESSSDMQGFICSQSQPGSLERPQLTPPSHVPAQFQHFLDPNRYDSYSTRQEEAGLSNDEGDDSFVVQDDVPIEYDLTQHTNSIDLSPAQNDISTQAAQDQLAIICDLSDDDLFD